MSDTGSYGFGDDMDDIDALSDDGAFGDLLENGVYNGADEFLPVLINASGDPTDEGLVFRRLPDMPLDADTSSYFDEAFIAACLEAHERHCAMPRRLFEDIERVAQAEERAARQLARLATSRNLQASPSFRAPSLGASPSFSHRRSVDVSPSSVGNNFSHLFSSGIGASPNTSNGSPKYLTNFLSESFRRHPSMDATAAARDDASDGSSEDSMEEWRKTVVVPPRSPSPPPADPVRLRDDNDNTTLHSFLPSIRRKASDSQSRDFRSYSIVAAAPRLLEPLEVLYANRLLTPMSTVDIDALTTKGVIELVRLSPGVELSRRGEASYASHALVLVSGEVSLMHSGQPLSTIASQGAVLLEEECRGAPGSHRSIVTLVVGGEGLQAWAVPRIVVQRITMAVQNQRRLAARAATGVF